MSSRRPNETLRQWQKRTGTKESKAAFRVRVKKKGCKTCKGVVVTFQSEQL